MSADDMELAKLLPNSQEVRNTGTTNNLLEAAREGDVNKLKKALNQISKLSPEEIQKNLTAVDGSQNNNNFLHMLACCKKRKALPAIINVLKSNDNVKEKYTAMILSWQMDNENNKPLHLACRLKSYKLATHLIDLYSNTELFIESKNVSGRTPIELICNGTANEAVDLLQLMLEKIKPREVSESLFQSMLKISITEAWDEKNGFSTNVLRHLMEKLYPSLSQFKLKSEAQRFAQRKLLLASAKSVGNEYAVNYLEAPEAEAPFVRSRNKPQSQASEHVHHVKPKTSKKNPALLNAICSGSVEVIKKLLAKPTVTVAVSNEANENSLHILAKQLYTSETEGILNLLLENLPGLDEKLNVLLSKDINGNTPIEVACHHKNDQMVQLFMKNPPDNRDYWKTQRITSTIMRELPQSLEASLNQSIFWATAESSVVSVDMTLLSGIPRSEIPLVAVSTSLDIEMQNTGCKCKSGDPQKPESEILFQILNQRIEPKMRNKILDHPVVALFLRSKWNVFAYISWTWTFSQLFLVVPLTIILLTTYAGSNPSRSESARNQDEYFQNLTVSEMNSNREAESSYPTFLLTLVVIMTTLTILNELLQIWLDWFEYFRVKRNWFQILLICTIWPSIWPAFYLPVVYQDYQLAIAAFCGFLAWMVVVKNLTYFPTCELYANIIWKVSITSLKMLIFFFPCLIAFWIAFRIFLPKDQFWFPFGFVKIITMMIGELGYDEYMKDPELTDITYSISQVFFMLFCFIISIVLLNLLIALAVYDIQDLVRDAEYSHIVCQLKFIHTAETTISSLMRASPNKRNRVYNWLNSCILLNSLQIEYRIEELNDNLQRATRSLLKDAYFEVDYTETPNQTQETDLSLVHSGSDGNAIAQPAEVA